MVVFGSKVDNEVSDREKVREIMNELGVNPGIVKVVDVIRMRKMKDDERI